MNGSRRHLNTVSADLRAKAGRPQSRSGRGAVNTSARRTQTPSTRDEATATDTSLGALRRQSTSRVRKHCVDPLTVQLDLASEIGLAIRDDFSKNAPVADANRLHMEQLAEDDYGSDDDLGDSELAQAEKMQTQLLARLANTDEELNCKWLEADQQDYELRGTVLDQDVITRRLELLKTFAEHLRNVGRNRASLLARLAEPLAEEHWMLDPEYHQRMVDALQNMCALINRLPDISAAARHCTAGLSVLPDSTDAAETGSDDSTRDIARMERLAHEVEQAAEWLQAENRSSAPLPKLTS